LLKTVPGIGPILASIILLEVGSIERFASAGNFASYARCVDSQHMSNDSRNADVRMGGLRTNANANDLQSPFVYECSVGGNGAMGLLPFLAERANVGES
jgi:hypothetical protein